MSRPDVFTPELYDRYRAALAREPLPCALVDVEAFDRNVAWVVDTLRGNPKRVRVASKSLRCVALLDRARAGLGDLFAGLMTYAAAETERLAGAGFDDLLLAYPPARADEAAALARAASAGATVRVVVDDPGQAELVGAAARAAGVVLEVVLDVDASLRLLAGRVHLGVRRSPIRSAAAAVDLAEVVASIDGVRLAGVMAYEAQVAGLADASPFSPTQNPVKALVRSRSRLHVAQLRQGVVEALKGAGLAPVLVNGGGTGSLASTGADPVVTEVTVGSGFLCSQLFDYYRELSLSPAAFFALPVCRRPDPETVTCRGGGYVASGEPGIDRLPRPVLPPGLSLLGMEGAGEVQTPLVGAAAATLRLGDPVFFRHAKAGELAERFNEYALVEGDSVVRRVPTYRGMGWCFG